MTSQKTQETLVNEQFGARAEAYVTSAVHAEGEDLKHLAKLVAGRKDARVLDLGCGGGHVSYNVAAHVGEVIAYDLSNDMLKAVAGEAKRRGLSNIGTVQGTAEKLPFPDDDFDFVFCRLSAHHWSDLPAGLRQARRVLKSGGKAVFIDAITPGRPLLDTFLQTIEMLRDPSHVRNYGLSEWISIAQRVGFNVVQVRQHRMEIDFQSWVQRMQTPAVHVEAIRSLQARMADDVKHYFALQPDGSFSFDIMTLELTIS